jgi:hypothetical protein
MTISKELLDELLGSVERPQKEGQSLFHCS